MQGGLKQEGSGRRHEVSPSGIEVSVRAMVCCSEAWLTRRVRSSCRVVNDEGSQDAWRDHTCENGRKEPEPRPEGLRESAAGQRQALAGRQTPGRARATPLAPPMVGDTMAELRRRGERRRGSCEVGELSAPDALRARAIGDGGRQLLALAPRVCEMGGESCLGLKKSGHVARGMDIPRAFIMRCSRPSAHFIDTFTLALPLL